MDLTITLTRLRQSPEAGGEEVEDLLEEVGAVGGEADHPTHPQDLRILQDHLLRRRPG